MQTSLVHFPFDKCCLADVFRSLRSVISNIAST